MPQHDANAARVLIVEDEWLIAASLEDDLREAGFDIVGPAPTLVAARKLLDEQHFNAAVLDVTLGEEKSYPIARLLIERGIPFLFLSGYTEGDLPVEFNGAPLMTKPANGALVARAIKALLAR